MIKGKFKKKFITWMQALDEEFGHLYIDKHGEEYTHVDELNKILSEAKKEFPHKDIEKMEIWFVKWFGEAK